MEISFLFSTDLHGDLDRMDGLLSVGSRSGNPPIILGGDLFRAGRGNDIASQTEILENQIEPRMESYRGDVYTIFGNNDWKVVADRIGELAPSLIDLQNHDAVLPSGLRLKGLSFVPPSPFLIKDWERMEKYGNNDERGRLEGLCSHDGGLRDCTISQRGTMWEEILKIGPLKDSILVSHGPPFGTCADMSVFEPHLGSVDLTRAAINDPPVAILCGHIHEAPDVSKKPVCSLGETLVANPGSKRGNLTYIEGKMSKGLVLEFRSL